MQEITPGSLLQAWFLLNQLIDGVKNYWETECGAK